MKRKTLVVLVALAVFLALAAGNAWAILYDTYLSDSYFSAGNKSNLYGLNNGSIASIGTIANGTTYYNVTDIGWVGGIMYGVGTIANGTTPYLLTINKESAAVTANRDIGIFSGTIFSKYTSLADNASTIYSTAAHDVGGSSFYSLINLTANSYVDLTNITYRDGDKEGTYRVINVGDMTTVKGVLYAAVDLFRVGGDDTIKINNATSDLLVTIAPDGTVALVTGNPNNNYLTNNLVGLAYSGDNLYGFNTDGNTVYRYKINYTAGTNETGTQLASLSAGHSLTGAAVPLPPSVYLFGSGLLGLIGLRRFRRS